MITIVDQDTSVDLSRRSASFVFESDDMQELIGGDTVQAALAESVKRGLMGAGISSRGTPYAVNADGSPITDVASGMPKGAKFRIDVKMLSAT